MAMKIHVVVIIGFLEGLLLAPTSAAAAGSPRYSGPELALRLGVAIPTGSVSSGTSLDTYAATAVPLIVEGGYRVDPSLFFGARFEYAFPDLKNPNGSCSGNTSCSGSVVTLGAEGIYRFVPEQTFAPWLGVGFGYEWASADYDRPNAGAGVTNKGIQALVQGGGDVRVNAQLVLGPFIEAAFGRFDSADTRVRLGNTTTETSADIANTAWHTWVALGVRGAFGF
jgi:hypothetical protein